MPPKNEICRYFQRGSCKYGTSCKFLHPKSQQSQTNPFGFGAQTGATIQRSNSQQPASNPFGFGIQNQNNAHSRGGDGFSSKPNQYKPFENKWSRFSNSNNNTSSSSRQSENQPPAANHKCTDPQSCKRIILEDFENEKPQWKLTCYGHMRDGPCDIVGDISYDELRALAYDDAKQGKSLQSIVEKERNMLNSKVIEFQNLAQKPYTVSASSTPSSQNIFTGGNMNAPVVNNGFSSQVSNFSQLSGILNTSSGSRSADAPNFSFGQKNTLQNNSQPSIFSQANKSPFTNSGTFPSQPQQSMQSFSPFGTTSPINGAVGAQQNPFSSPASSLQTGNGADKQFNLFNSEPNLASGAFGQTTVSTQLINNIAMENGNVDGGIWSKAEWKWNIGEIPEDAPPDVYIER